MNDNSPLNRARGVPDLTALRAIAEIRSGHMSPLDVIDASIARIEATDPVINAIPVRCFEAARVEAKQMMEAKARGGEWPMLCGLPLAVKDNSDVAGVPTSGGSALTAGRVPTVSDPAIARMENAGAIVIGKSNLSELGGANTVNALFGATRNPLFPALTAGGSSGGTAAALAAGQVHLGHGNDVGGSLRTPAAFCGIVGLRPTPGLVPRKMLADAFDTVFVEGPMARDVGDLALVLDVMAGFHAADLLSRERLETFSSAVQYRNKTARIAVSADLGLLPVDQDTRSGFAGAFEALHGAGFLLEEDAPDLSGAPDMIKALRGLNYLTSWGHLWPENRAGFTEEVATDIARGAALSAGQIARAINHRAALYRRLMAFFTRFDVLICPTTQVQPFPVECRWPTEIDGEACDSYVDWIMITYVWSVMGCPALALPFGRDAAGMPVSLQLVGPPHSEAKLIALAAQIEEIAPQS